MNDRLKPYLYMLAGSIVGVACVYAYLGGFVPAPRFEQEGYLADVPNNAIELASGTPVSITSRRLYRPWGTWPWTWVYECKRPDGTEVSLDDSELIGSATAEDEYSRALDKRRDTEREQQLVNAPYGEILEEGGSLVVRNIGIPRRVRNMNLIEHRKECPGVRILGQIVHQRYVHYWTEYGTKTVVPFPQAGDNIVWRVEEPYEYSVPKAMVECHGGANMTFSGVYAKWEEGMPDTFMYSGATAP